MVTNNSINVATAASGTILRGAGVGSAPVFSTSTYPNTNAVSTLLYASSANVMGALATANSAILNTNSSGVPSLATSPSVSGTLTAATGLTATSGPVTAGTNLLLPTTSSTAGNLLINSQRVLHNFGSATNIFLGALSGNYTLTATNCTAVGRGTMALLTSGIQNSCIGDLSLAALTSGQDNFSGGYAAGNAITQGNGNISIGTQSNTTLTTGSNNTSVGYRSGFSYTSSETNNVCLGYNVLGTAAESNTIRLGNSSHTSAYITGVNGVTVTGTAVLCATNGQMGTIVSSIRYKENIEDLGSYSSEIFNLRPVKFTYKCDQSKTVKYGLIAEEVDSTLPYLSFYNDEGQPESVLYHELPVLILNELQKMNERIKQLESKVV